MPKGTTHVSDRIIIFIHVVATASADTGTHKRKYMNKEKLMINIDKLLQKMLTI